jgi:hypothetical protein
MSDALLVVASVLIGCKGARAGSRSLYHIDD